MKMDKYRKVSAVLLVFVCGFLLFELFVLKERSIKMISKAVVIILANIFFIFRLRMRDGNMPLSVYEAKFKDIIEDAFNSEPADRKSLLKALRKLCRSQYKSAIAAFDKLEEKAVTSKEHSVILQFKALCYQNNGQLLNAIPLYEALVQLNPDNAVARVNLAYLYQETESNEKAVDAYKKALEYAPENTTAYNNLGYLYIKMNCPAEALENAQKALELDETLYFSEETAAMASALLGDRELSEEYYQRCVQHRQNPKKLREVLDMIWKNKT